MIAYADALAALREHRSRFHSFDLREAFRTDPQRFSRFSASLDDLTLDYSKCAVTDETMRLLAQLAEAAGVAGRRDAMFAGEEINITEHRAVLHTALRHSGGPVHCKGRDVMADVQAVLAAMEEFASGIRSGSLKGATGKRFTDVVNIGIGGSDLGPCMATLALAPYHDGPALHYVSNVDAAHIADTLARLDPETTLI